MTDNRTFPGAEFFYPLLFTGIFFDSHFRECGENSKCAKTVE